MTSKKGRWTEVIDVTPEMARIWIRDMADGNRNVKVPKMKRYAKLMDEGKWIHDLSPICFNSGDKLVNGQHRLAAVMRCGKTIKMTIMHNVDKDYLRYMDTGASRTASDILQMSGITNSRGVATIITNEFWYKQRLLGIEGEVQTEDDILEEAQAYPRIHDIHNWSKRVYMATRIVSGPLGAAMLIIDRAEPDKEAVAQFMSKIEYGNMLIDGHPVLALRNNLIRFVAQKGKGGQSGPNAKPAREHIMKCVIIAWNMFALGEDLNTIKPPEEFIEVFPVQSRRWMAHWVPEGDVE